MPVLAQCLEDASGVLREHAVEALRKVDGADLAPAVPALTRCLEQQSDVIVQAAAVLYGVRGELLPAA